MAPHAVGDKCWTLSPMVYKCNTAIFCDIPQVHRFVPGPHRHTQQQPPQQQWQLQQQEQLQQRQQQQHQQQQQHMQQQPPQQQWLQEQQEQQQQHMQEQPPQQQWLQHYGAVQENPLANLFSTRTDFGLGDDWSLALPSSPELGSHGQSSHLRTVLCIYLYNC
jgi:hypothetical protein